MRLGTLTTALARLIGLLAPCAILPASRFPGAAGLIYSRVCQARVAAGQGQEDDCRRHVAAALESGSRLGSDSIVVHGGSALALLALGMKRSEEAITHLEPVAAFAQKAGVHDPALVQWLPDLVEAYIRAGRIDRAQETLAELRRQGQHTNRTWALAAACRCRGLLSAEGDYERAFEEAVGWHDRGSSPFEKARTELCWGERLRRSGRRVRARTPLRSALQTFDELGAEPWATRARSELRGSGQTLQPRGERQRLTPQELQVALTVADGATNREAAAALFLSPKTIEFHLGHVYSKLGLRSRSQLATLLAEPHPLTAHGVPTAHSDPVT